MGQFLMFSGQSVKRWNFLSLLIFNVGSIDVRPALYNLSNFIAIVRQYTILRYWMHDIRKKSGILVGKTRDESLLSHSSD
jgi:hypothetical protein